MPVVRWLIGGITGFLVGQTQARRARLMAKEREAGTFEVIIPKKPRTSKTITTRPRDCLSCGSIGGSRTATMPD